MASDEAEHPSSVPVDGQVDPVNEEHGTDVNPRRHKLQTGLLMSALCVCSEIWQFIAHEHMANK